MTIESAFTHSDMTCTQSMKGRRNNMIWKFLDELDVAVCRGLCGHEGDDEYCSKCEYVMIKEKYIKGEYK